MQKVATVDVAGSSMEVTMESPENAGSPFPALILCHHREGVDEFTIDAAKKLAGAGFLTAVPNFYHRRPRSEGWQASRKTMQDVEVVADLKAVANFLKTLRDVNADRIGIIGHCMGGRTAFIGATALEKLKAAVILYGGHLFKTEGKGSLPPIENVGNVTAPILGLYGDEDHVIPLEEIKRFIAVLNTEKIENEFHIYRGAGHAFQDFSRSDHYRSEASEDAWRRTIEFLRNHLSG
jgi:carboxymethylenebutenolidase